MERFKLTVIGCGDAFNSGGRLHTCFYVETTAGNILVDCGATSLAGLKSNNIDPDTIDSIFITHFHGDHYGGLPYLLLNAAIFGRSKPLNIVSPPGCRDKVGQLLNLLYPTTPVLQKLDINFVEYHAHQPLKVGGINLLAYPVIHTEAALPHGLKITIDDKILSYSGDTSWTNELVELASGADLFICECNFFMQQGSGHLSFLELKEKLSLINSKQLLLTHFDTEMLNNLHQIELPCAKDGMVVKF